MLIITVPLREAPVLVPCGRTYAGCQGFLPLYWQFDQDDDAKTDDILSRRSIFRWICFTNVCSHSSLAPATAARWSQSVNIPRHTQPCYKLLVQSLEARRPEPSSTGAKKGA